MPKITAIVEQKTNSDRVSVYVDGVFCTGMRKRTFQDMGIARGDEISCERLKEMESHFWKEKYGTQSWEKEKVRLNKVKKLIDGNINDAVVKITGFGADSTEIIREHAAEQGVPDLSISNKDNPDNVLVRIEVTGTERLRGDGYWVRPDKLEYAENHPDQDVWIVLHFAEPEEKFVCIKPAQGKKYQRHEINIKGAGEIFCIFNDGDEEIKTVDQFLQHIATQTANS